MNRQQLDPTHSFDVADALKYGSIEKALIIKEIRGMQLYKLDHGAKGWVYYSGSALAAKFPYIKQRTLERYMVELVAGGHLEETVQNKVSYDRTKSYRLPDIALDQTLRQNGESTRQNGGSITQNGGSIGQNGGPIPSRTTSLTTSHYGRDDKKAGENRKNDHRGEPKARAMAERIREQYRNRKRQLPATDIVRQSGLEDFKVVDGNLPLNEAKAREAGAVMAREYVPAGTGPAISSFLAV